MKLDRTAAWLRYFKREIIGKTVGMKMESFKVVPKSRTKNILTITLIIKEEGWK